MFSPAVFLMFGRDVTEGGGTIWFSDEPFTSTATITVVGTYVKFMHYMTDLAPR